MKLFNVLLVLFLGTSIFSCGGDSEENSSGFSLNLIENKTEFQLGESIKAQIKGETSTSIDSVVYFFAGERLEKTGGNETFQYIFREEKLGKWIFTAKIYSKGNNSKLEKEITLFNNTPPVIYTYEIIAKYPHASDAYTQGLEFYKDTLYESTGEYGESTLRKVNFKTGEVLKSQALEDDYFGEGLTIFEDKIYQLTWREGIGFIYDVDTFEKLGSFAYSESKEGWGLTNDGEKFYKSDGSEKIWILNAETMAEEGYIQTVTQRTISTKLNELEWVEGKIYANTYQKDGVAIIDPKNGAIVGLINFHGLREQLNNEDELDPVNDVLNGIAYNPNTGKLYVTGKDWDTLFEVKIIEE